MLKKMLSIVIFVALPINRGYLSMYKLFASSNELIPEDTIIQPAILYRTIAMHNTEATNIKYFIF